MTWTMPVSAPAYPLRWTCHASEGVEVVYDADEDAVRAAVAATPFEFVTARMVFYGGRMIKHDLGMTNSWNFSSLSVPVRFNKRISVWSIYMFVDDCMAILAGRELLGEPKKWGDIGWQRETHGCRFTLGLLGEVVARFQVEFGEDLPGSAVTGPLGLVATPALLNHRVSASPLGAVEPVEDVIAVRFNGTFRYRAAHVREFVIEPSRNSRLDELLAPLHRFAPRSIVAANLREGGFENGVGANCELFPQPRKRAA